MKKTLVLILLLIVLFSASSFAESTFPEALRFTPGQVVTVDLDDCHATQTLLPDTSRDDVDAALAALHEQMMQDALPHLLAAESSDEDPHFTLRITTAVLRTGSSWMSFYTTATIDDGIDQLYVAFDARVYDMENGKRIALSDVVTDPTALLPMIREGLEAYFPGETPDLEHLGELAFTLSPGSLRFHFRADAVYPGKDALLHVKLYYPSLTGMLTDEALRQTTNDRPLIALTFDDGPARFRTVAVVNMLKAYGADGTFFLVGERLATDVATVKYQHSSCFDLACHSFSHITRAIGHSQAREEVAMFNEALQAITGKGATIMRAPGGYEKPYVSAEVGLPLFHWTVASGDGTSTRRYDKRGLEEIYDKVTWNAVDGAVVLFHDLRDECPLYLEPILQYLEENGFLCVTVEELFSIKGIPLDANVVYDGAGIEKD